MHLKYYLGALFTLPLLPLLYLQGKRIKASVPVLPAATGPEGAVIGGHERSIRLLAIGESTVAGVGTDTHAAGIAGSLAAELSLLGKVDVHWRVYARSGYTTRQLEERILPIIADKEADLIVVGTGGNDAFQLRSIRAWEKDVRRLIVALRQRYPDAPIYFMNMPPIRLFPAFTPLIKRTIGSLVEMYGILLARIASEQLGVYYNAEIIDLLSWQQRHGLSGPASDFFSDGVHPAPVTYHVWGKEMARFIVSKGGF